MTATPSGPDKADAQATPGVSPDANRAAIGGMDPSGRVRFVVVHRKRRSPLVRMAFIATIAVGAAAFWYAEDIKSYVADQLRELTQSTGIELPFREEAKAPSEFAPVYSRLAIDPLPASLERQSDISRGLARLNREPCDKEAIFSVGEALVKSGNARMGANAYLGYAASCANGEGDKRRAADILLSLADYDQTIRITSDLIAANPANPSLRYLRGQAMVGVKRYDEALTDYANTIELFDKPRSVGEWVFLEMSNIYVSLKQYCLAITPIQTYVAIDPVNRDTPRMRKLILDYGSQGNCERRYATGSDNFSYNGDNVIRTKVSVNGVDGVFVVDTGASFVVLTSGFAARAKVTTTAQSVPVETANGSAESMLGRAASIRVGRTESDGCSDLDS